MRRPGTILIAGPTASGKSGLALDLAERLGGAVVNADSMQVYRDLSILTARPGAADLARVPHHLYGFVDGADPYSAGRFARDAAVAIAAARSEGRLPIVVGGTGLYFMALTEGLAPVPEIPTAVRRHWREEVSRLGPAAAHAVLSRRDPEMAGRLPATDPQRIARALEVLDSTGRSLAAWQRMPGTPAIDPGEAVLRLVLDLPREEIQRRCDARLDAMVAGGALAEATALARRGLAPELPVMRAVGLRPLLACCAGRMALDAALADARRETRHFVKRQQTWLSRNMIAWKRVETIENVEFNDWMFP